MRKMTKEESKKEAEEYRKDLKSKFFLSEPQLDLACQGFKDGYSAGAKAHLPQWHDLEKDPTDLPKDYKTMCICLGDFGSTYQPVPRVCVGYCDSLGWSDYMGSSLYSTVRYWCELPKFEEAEND